MLAAMRLGEPFAFENKDAPVLKGNRPDHRGPNGNTQLTVLFRIDDPEQLKAMSQMADSFKGHCCAEPIIRDLLWALHIMPGVDPGTNVRAAA